MSRKSPSCAPEVASTLDASKLKILVSKYQISREFRPRLSEGGGGGGEWCCSPSSGFGLYTSYLLAGLRFLLNSFCRGLFHRLGIGPNQLNLNGWRTIVAMQVLWHEVLKGNCPSIRTCSLGVVVVVMRVVRVVQVIVVTVVPQTSIIRLGSLVFV